MTLHINLLGQFKILANNTPLDLPSRPAQSLLAYLCLNAGTVHRRETLAGMLWPDTTDSNARSYLRQALWRIRKAFEESDVPCDSYLDITDLSISFHQNSNYWLDANMVLKPVEEQSTQELMENLQHYTGELLPGFYDEWILPERDRFQAVYHHGMNFLLDRLIQAEQWAETIKWGEQWIKLGYAPEPAFRALMRAYASLGDRGMVNATYQRCEKALEQDLGVMPSQETQILFQQLCREETRPETPTSKPRTQTRTQTLDLFSGEPPIPYEQPTFVARDLELNRLDGFLDQVFGCDGQTIFITGEAGSGKSALIHEFTRLAQSAHPELIVASGYCNAQTGIGDPYMPFREILEILTGDIKARWDAGAISKSLAQAIWNILPITARAITESGTDLIDTFIPGTALLERVQQIGLVDADWYHRLEDLIDLRIANPYLQNPPQTTFFEQYIKVMQETSQHVPLILVIDDLQWADLGSISLLFHLGRQLAGCRLLIIGAYRPEEVLVGRNGDRHPLVPVIRELQRIHGDIIIDMDQAESWAFMEAFLDSEPNRLGEEFRQMLYRQTRGHPLFTIEFLRGLQDRGDLIQDEKGVWIEGAALDWETFPARVEAVITERIDRLPAAMQTALHIASVEGDVFTAEVVAQVQDINKHELLNQLSNDLDRKHRLVKAQSIQRVNNHLLSNYRFQHVQFQKYLYNSLDQVERVHLHEQIGQILESLYEVKEIPENLKDISTSVTPIVRLAHHFQEAQNIPKAISYLYLAGERAVQLSAYQDGITHLNKGLALLETLPKTPERNRQELSLLLALTKALKGAEGMAPPEVERILKRAQAVGQHIGEPSQLCSLIGELTIVYFVRAEYLRAKQLAQEVLELSINADDPIQIAIGRWQLGFVEFALGDFVSAREHLQQVITAFDPGEYHHQFIFFKGTNVVLSAMAYDACCLWCLGYPDQAVDRCQETIHIAHHFYHPFTMADVITFCGCLLNEMRGNPTALLEYANTIIELSDRIGMGWRGAAWKFRGEARIMLGQFKEGKADVLYGMREEYARAARCFETGARGFLAYTQELNKKDNLDIHGLQDVIALAETRGEFYFLSELHRMKAELFLIDEKQSEAEASFQKALQIARQQNAKSWELRAAIGLSKLWADQGKTSQAKEILLPLYRWFTEGFETKEYIQAKQLLEQIETHSAD